MTGILVALDLPTVDRAVDLAASIKDHVSGFKVGLGLLHGESGSIERIADLGLPVFADAKLHDIPAQVESAARALGQRGARWVTAHIPGGSEMLRAAVAGLAEGSDGKAGILGVSVLTSIGEEDLADIGVRGPADAAVERLVQIAAGVPVEGIVSAVHEVSIVRRVSPALITVTPGIRPLGVGDHDQKRTATVQMGIEAGADYLVVGRAISASDDPVGAAAAIAEEIGAGSRV
ncbi:MAG: orotidine-5'-phosphate decarboxylase [Acidimicrobiia bacterium]